MQVQQTQVAIVGNGVAGLSLSLLLERAGVDHVVLARAQKRKLPCLGETLPPSTLALLERLGFRALFEESARKKSLGYHALWHGRPLTDINFFTHRPFQYGLKMDKPRLVARMMELVEKRVVEMRGSWEWDAEKRTVTWRDTGKRREIQAQVYVDATGRSAALLRQMGIPTTAYDRQLAFSCVLPRVHHPRIKHDVFTESFAGGWGNLSGLDDQTQSLTLFAEKGSPLALQLRDYQHWADALARTVLLKAFLGTGVTPDVRGSAAHSSRADRMAGRDWLALGDAALAFDPLSSHGISNAVYTAWRASEAIVQSLRERSDAPLTTYHDTLAHIFDGYLQARRQHHGIH